MTPEQRADLIMTMAHDYPLHRIWWVAGIWYATGPCGDPACSCSRTLHAPDAGHLCKQLTAVNEARTVTA